MPSALDFPASPTVGQTYPNPPVTGQPTYQWDGAQWLSKFALGKEYVPLDGAAAMTGLLTLSGDPINPLHAATKQYTDAGLLRSNYAKKNYIINGAMMISQENGTTPVIATGAYPVDQFALVGTATVPLTGVAQVASATPGGSPNRIRATSGGAATPASGTFLVLRHRIEGLRIADLLFGSAGAKTFTLQFGVKAPAGTYGITFANNANDRINILNFTIAAGEANTDVVKSVTLTGDTTGTWTKDNTLGLLIDIVLTSAGTIQGAPAGWQAFGGGGFFTTGQFNFFSASGVFELFDVSLTEGSVAPPFQVPDYVSELAACKRYYQIYRYTPSQYIGTLQAVSASQATGALLGFPELRAVPAISMNAAISSFTLQGAAGGGGALNNVTVVAAPTSFSGSFFVASGLVAGNATALYANTSASVSVNARL